MFTIETPRLLLVRTPVDVMRKRLRQAGFSADVQLGDEIRRITFPAEWPGDELAIFPLDIAHREARPEDEPWGGMIIDRAENVVVGGMGCKGKPDASGRIEFGYGINPAYQRRGYATEMAGALVAWLLEQPNVRRVVAETREDNIASQRVLQKVGLRQIGNRVDPDDGPLIIWELAR